jgi:hypothetical protein
VRPYRRVQRKDLNAARRHLFGQPRFEPGILLPAGFDGGIPAGPAAPEQRREGQFSKRMNPSVGQKRVQQLELSVAIADQTVIIEVLSKID